MADPTLVATAKATNANSYVTRAEAQTYMDERLDVDTWTDASDGDQDRALIMATKRLNQEQFHGRMTTTTQALQWPRSGTHDKDGNDYDQDTVPTPVKEATYEAALALLNGDLEIADTGLEGFDAAAVGALKVDLVRGHAGGKLPAECTRLLADVRVGADGFTVPLLRG